MTTNLRRRSWAIASTAAAVPALLLAHCVGDTVTNNPTPDSGAQPDTSTQDTGNGGDAKPLDGGAPDADAAIDTGPTCNLGDAAAGSLDFSFSSGVKDLGTFSPNAVAVDSKGRVYVAGTSADCGFAASGVVHRFNADGTHDNTFGGAATGVCIHYDNVDAAYAVAIDDTGGVVVGGLAYGTRLHATLTRLATDGSFDTTFNGTGKLDLDPSSSMPSGFAAVLGLAFDGKKIVATGSSEAIRPGVGTRKAGYIVRVNADGTVDSLFAGGLYVDKNVSGYYGVTVGPGSGVVAVGSTTTAPRKLVVRALKVDGTDDMTFGTAGALTTAAPLADGGGGATEGRALIAIDGGYLVGAPLPALNGGDYASGPAGSIAVTSAGAVDTTYGANGGVSVPPLVFNIGYQLTAFAPECDGKILFGARYDDPEAGATPQDMGLTRLLPNGTLDTGFGTSGVTHLALAGNEIVVGVVLDPTSGKIVVVGANQSGKPILARFNP